MPSWAWAIYAVAVAAGTLGALCLLLRSKGRVAPPGIEVIAVLIQFGYTFFGTDLMAHKWARGNGTLARGDHRDRDPAVLLGMLAGSPARDC